MRVKLLGGLGNALPIDQVCQLGDSPPGWLRPAEPKLSDRGFVNKSLSNFFVVIIVSVTLVSSCQSNLSVGSGPRWRSAPKAQRHPRHRGKSPLWAFQIRCNSLRPARSWPLQLIDARQAQLDFHTSPGVEGSCSAFGGRSQLTLYLSSDMSYACRCPAWPRPLASAWEHNSGVEQGSCHPGCDGNQLALAAEDLYQRRSR